VHFLRTKQAKTLAQAYTLAANESPDVAARAGLPSELTDQKHRDRAALLRRYAGPGTATPQGMPVVLIDGPWPT